MNNLPRINIDIEVANIALEYRKKHKIKLPDALILASCKNIKGDLIINNIVDFNKIDSSIKILQPEHLK